MENKIATTTKTKTIILEIRLIYYVHYTPSIFGIQLFYPHTNFGIVASCFYYFLYLSQNH